MRSEVLAISFALAACGGVSDEGPQAEPTATAAAARPIEPTARPLASTDREAAVPAGSQAITAVGDLLGEYRVAGIDGTEVRGDMGIALSIDGPMLSYEPTCAGFVWDIGVAGGRFTLKRAAGYGPVRQPDGTIMACLVAVSPEQRRLAEVIDAVSTAWRTPSNGIVLAGNGRSVLLFGQ